MSLKALIRNENDEILFVREKGDFGLPGGGWDYNETAHGVLARELREEVGLEGDFTERIIGTVPRWLERKQAWLLWIVYEISCDTSNFYSGVDAEEIAWVREKDIDMSIPSGPMIMKVLTERNMNE